MKYYHLSHFSPIFHFCTPWKRQKTFRLCTAKCLSIVFLKKKPPVATFGNPFELTIPKMIYDVKVTTAKWNIDLSSFSS